MEMFLVPSVRKYFDPPACLPELVPKLPVGLAPAMERASDRHARINLGEDGLVTLDDDWHRDVEIPDAPVGVASVDAFRE